MSAKSVVTTGLLLFVAASLVALAAKGLRRDAEIASGADPSAGQANAETSEPPITDGLIAYYFHGDIRCPTCESIEAYAEEAVTTGFAEPIEENRLAWRVVNYQMPQNDHFAEEFELITATVVLVDVRDGVHGQWKNLVRVWELVGDKEAFIEYVQKEIAAYLEAE